MNIQQFKREVKGRFFKAYFIKKDGSFRQMIARLGVKKYLKGGGLNYNPDDYNNLIVFDMESKVYRTISIDRLISIKYNGKEWIGKNALQKVLTWLDNYYYC